MQAQSPTEVQKLWSTYFDAHDLDALAQLYEPGAAWLTGPGSVLTRRDTVIDNLKAMRAATESLTIGTAQVLQADDLAILYAPWTATVVDSSGERVLSTGTTSDVVRRQSDGTWLLAIDNPWLVPSAVAVPIAPTAATADHELSTVSRDELGAALAAGTVTLVDALAATSYSQQHIAGALNLPADRVAADAGTLLPDKARPIVVYCASIACSQDTVVAGALARQGYRDVRIYPEGLEGWTEAGLPVESGS
ncbi:MAG: rhodanese-like domain-containing protein [Acidimicrobiia bacterium]